jgi:hypothetical protein
MLDYFYIKHHINDRSKSYVKKCHLKNGKIHHLKRHEINLCGIFGVPVKMNLNVSNKVLPQRTKNIFCSFPQASLDLLANNVPTNKHKFLGLIE